jgi:hypothetical protein
MPRVALRDRALQNRRMHSARYGSMASSSATALAVNRTGDLVRHDQWRRAPQTAHADDSAFLERRLGTGVNADPGGADMIVKVLGNTTN